MRRWIWGLAFLIFLTLIGAYFTKLGDFVSVMIRIGQLPSEQRAKAEQMFYAGGGADGYSGILAYVNRRGHGGVWIWGQAGLRYFASDEFSVYSHYSACNDDVISLIERGEPFSVERMVTAAIDEWGQRAKPGDYIELSIATAAHGGNLGKAREIKGWDWWVFMPVDIKELCAK